MIRCVMTTRPDANVAAPVVLDDRRRPGRRNDVSSELIDLLRGTGRVELLSVAENEDTHSLSAARGIKSAIVLSTTVWAFTLISIVWLLM